MIRKRTKLFWCAEVQAATLSQSRAIDSISVKTLLEYVAVREKIYNHRAGWQQCCDHCKA